MKENKLDRFTFMNVDGWIFGIDTFVGIKTKWYYYGPTRGIKITNISDILKSIFSCYAGKHRKYASNQYLLYFSSFFYVNQYSEMSNKMETHSQHKKNRLVKPYILILPLLEDTQYPMSIYFHCSFVENNQ